MSLITVADIEAARDRIDDDTDIVQRTPVDRSRSVSRIADADVHLKMEHLQRTGSFKTRGAYNKMQKLATRDDVRRVVAASAGNHAQGVALAATTTGFDATIVMPQTAPQTKIDATEGYGAEVVLEGTDFRAAMSHAQSLGARGGTAFVHAYDDPDIVEGQGTLGLEVVEEVPDVDTVVVPIGGGGLISGVAAAVKGYAPDVRVVGVQAEAAATVPASLKKDSPQSLERVDTIADGIATGGISELTLAHIQEYVDEVVTVTDQEIARGIVTLLERAKQLVEGAGAASVAALIGGDVDVTGETVVPLLCGGNLDMSMLQTILTHELSSRRQLLRLRVRIDDEPGEMNRLSGIFAETGANIRTVHHNRADASIEVGEAFLFFLVETSGQGHADAIRTAIEDAGYEVERVN